MGVVTNLKNGYQYEYCRFVGHDDNDRELVCSTASPRSCHQLLCYTRVYTRYALIVREETFSSVLLVPVKSTEQDSLVVELNATEKRLVRTWPVLIMYTLCVFNQELIFGLLCPLLCHHEHR